MAWYKLRRGRGEEGEGELKFSGCIEERSWGRERDACFRESECVCVCVCEVGVTRCAKDILPNNLSIEKKERKEGRQTKKERESERERER